MAPAGTVPQQSGRAATGISQNSSREGPTAATAFVAPLAVALIWGVNVPIMKAGLEELDPFVFNALRLSLSALALGIADLAERRSAARGRRGSSPRDSAPQAPRIPWRTILWFGFLSSFVYQVLFLAGMDATSASNTALIIASGPLWTALLSRAYGVEHHSRRALLALGVAFIGTMLVTATGAKAADGSSPGTLVGNIIVLAAMIAWAWATVLSRPILEWFPATRLAFLSTLVSLPLHWTVVAVRADWSSLRATTVDTETTDRPVFLVFAVVYSGVLSTGVAYALWNRSVRALGPARTASFSYLVPVFGLAVAWWFLNERPLPVQLAGGALVIAGLAARR